MDARLRSVFVSGRFNVVHLGHLRLLAFARELGGRLIVAVESDKQAGMNAYIDENQRLNGIRALPFVDEAFVMRKSLHETLMELRPTFVVKGRGHESRENAETVALDSYGGVMVFSSGTSLEPSILSLEDEYGGSVLSLLNVPQDFLTRHSISQSGLVNCVKNFAKVRVCVLGDLIIDEYVSCQVIGLSQEEPVTVVRPVEERRFIGGAAIVAAHASSLGATTRFLSAAGDDSDREYALGELQKLNVDAQIIPDEARDTTIKRRYRSEGRGLLRVNRVTQARIPNRVEEQIKEQLVSFLDQIDLMLLSDFNYGCLPNSLIEFVISRCSQNKIVICADSQSSSQIGDISRFKGVDLITPTEREASIAVRDSESGLVHLADRLMSIMDVRHVVMTLGSDGVLIHTSASSDAVRMTDRLPALNKTPRDSAGAGDCLLAVAGLALVTGASIWEASALGSIAAGIQVARVGNRPITSLELLGHFTE